MSIKTNIVIDQAALDSIRDQLTWIADGSERGSGRVTVKALNITAGQGSRQISRELGKVVNLKQSEIKKFIRLGKATFSKPVNNVLTRARPLSLSRFPVKQTAAGVDANVFRGGAAVSEKSAFIASSQVHLKKRGLAGFIARVFGGSDEIIIKGGPLVFRRKGKARYPLAVVRADDLVKIMTTRTPGFDPVASQMTENLAKQIDRGIHFELLKAQRSARKSLTK